MAEPRLGRHKKGVPPAKRAKVTPQLHYTTILIFLKLFF